MKCTLCGLPVWKWQIPISRLRTNDTHLKCMRIYNEGYIEGLKDAGDSYGQILQNPSARIGVTYSDITNAKLEGPNSIKEM